MSFVIKKVEYSFLVHLLSFWFYIAYILQNKMTYFEALGIASLKTDRVSFL